MMFLRNILILFIILLTMPKKNKAKAQRKFTEINNLIRQKKLTLPNSRRLMIPANVIFLFK